MPTAKPHWTVCNSGLVYALGPIIEGASGGLTLIVWNRARFICELLLFCFGWRVASRNSRSKLLSLLLSFVSLGDGGSNIATLPTSHLDYSAILHFPIANRTGPSCLAIAVAIAITGVAIIAYYANDNDGTLLAEMMMNTTKANKERVEYVIVVIIIREPGRRWPRLNPD